MSAQVSIAKDIATGREAHIDEIPFRSRAEFICCGCKTKLIPVKTQARKKDWHFRHPSKSDILKCRSTALHDYAVQVLKDNTNILLSKYLKISYTVIGTEVWLNDSFRSDITVQYENDVLHFEVYVTHDLTQDKINYYENSKIRCCRIDLSNKIYLSAHPEVIKDQILSQYTLKTLYGWNKDLFVKESEIAPHKKWYEYPENIFGAIVIAVLGYFAFFRKRKSK